MNHLLPTLKSISEEQLKAIFPNCKEDKIKVYCAAFNKILPQYDMMVLRRLAAFLGQIAVESGELKYDKELRSKWNTKNVSDPADPTGSNYEGRKSTLGNYVAGDGARFIGRGIIQITGRANYTRMGAKLALDLVKNPDLACEPENAVRIACEYWKDRGISAQADAWNLTRVTELINGTAKLHHDKRVQYTERALKVLTGGEA